MAKHFEIEVDVTMKFTVGFADRLADCILSSGTEDKQLKAFAHHIQNTFDGDDGKQQERGNRRGLETVRSNWE